ncbi:DUF2938 domain-containing protein [Methylibium sp.]|uniref:DUF2938 domain-containing protein n=1 Tax=Methylibium sp. TaxID=2067992 RepID=UPI0025E0181D|nr:DUF2938 domain-containing protein [Methylibium sp.]
MSPLLQDMLRVSLIGIGATAAMDLWLWCLKRVGLPGLNFAFIGRWVGHVFRGTWSHDAMTKAAPIQRELALGWLTHYAVGVAFAGVLASLYGTAWLSSPSLVPALCVGLGSVVAPLVIMQPAMGAGVASSKTATPLKNCLKSVANHAVFGLGLYLSAVTLERISRW